MAPAAEKAAVLVAVKAAVLAAAKAEILVAARQVNRLAANPVNPASPANPVNLASPANPAKLVSRVRPAKRARPVKPGTIRRTMTAPPTRGPAMRQGRPAQTMGTAPMTTARRTKARVMPPELPARMTQAIRETTTVRLTKDPATIDPGLSKRIRGTSVS